MKYFIRILFIGAACVALFLFVAKQIESHALPPLGDILASSTTTFNQLSREGAFASTTLFEDMSSSTTSVRLASSSIRVIGAPHGIIHAEIADTDAKRELGLSYRVSLATSSGMIFEFPEPLIPGFWMKGMNFALDMIWVDQTKRVVSITRNITPDTYPYVARPDVPISYVLEVNAGIAQVYGIATGTLLRF